MCDVETGRACTRPPARTVPAPAGQGALVPLARRIPAPDLILTRGNKNRDLVQHTLMNLMQWMQRENIKTVNIIKCNSGMSLDSRDVT